VSQGLDYRNDVLLPTVKRRIAIEAATELLGRGSDACPIGDSFHPTNTVPNDSIFLVLSSAARECPSL
jgi:hypothetical protein